VTLWPRSIVPLSMQVGASSDAVETGLQLGDIYPALSFVPEFELEDSITYFDLWRYKTVFGQVIGDSVAVGCTVGVQSASRSGCGAAAPAGAPKTMQSHSLLQAARGRTAAAPRSPPPPPLPFLRAAARNLPRDVHACRPPTTCYVAGCAA